MYLIVKRCVYGINANIVLDGLDSVRFRLLPGLPGEEIPLGEPNKIATKANRSYLNECWLKSDIFWEPNR